MQPMMQYRRQIAATFLVASFVFGNTVAAAITPNDPRFLEQRYLTTIGAPTAWETTQGSRDVVVAVIDTGVDQNHEDLRDNMWVNDDEIADNGIDDDDNGYIDDRNGWDFLADVASPNPKFQTIAEVRDRPLVVHHGTIVAGLIAAVANNGKGIVGVAPRVRIMPLRAFSARGFSNLYVLTRAIDYAVANGASIINVSADDPTRSRLLLQALRRAYTKGVVVVGSAGNDSDERGGIDLDVKPLYPVCAEQGGIPYVIGVGAVDDRDQKTSFSHFGARCVDLVAPGVELLSTTAFSPRFGFTDPYAGEWSGTSFSTALVTGAAALLRSIDPTLSPIAVRAFLKAGATDLTATDPTYGKRFQAGRLDIGRSVELLRTPKERMRILAEVSPSRRSALLAFATIDNRQPTQLMVTDALGKTRTQWFPFGSRYKGNVHIHEGDVDGDQSDEILVSAGNGGGPHVRTFTKNGDLFGQFFAYPSDDRSGVSVAVGDANPDGEKELVFVSGKGRLTEAIVASLSGEKQLSFFPFGDTWSDGALVRMGDVDGDAFDDVVFATEWGGTARIRVTNIFGEELFSFRPYSDASGPVSITLADIDGDGIMEIVTARGNGDPEVRVWKRDVLIANFFAYASSFRHGVVVTGGDVDGDGFDEIIAVPRANGGAHVKIFSGEGLLLRQFFIRDKRWRGGIEVAILHP